MSKYIEKTINIVPASDEDIMTGRGFRQAKLREDAILIACDIMGTRKLRGARMLDEVVYYRELIVDGMSFHVFMRSENREDLLLDFDQEETK